MITICLENIVPVKIWIFILFSLTDSVHSKGWTQRLRSILPWFDLLNRNVLILLNHLRWSSLQGTFFRKPKGAENCHITWCAPPKHTYQLLLQNTNLDSELFCEIPLAQPKSIQLWTERVTSCSVPCRYGTLRTARHILDEDFCLWRTCWMLPRWPFDCVQSCPCVGMAACLCTKCYASFTEVEVPSKMDLAGQPA